MPHMSKRPTGGELWKFSRNKNNTSSGCALQQAHKSHPDAYHTSRILVEKIAKSKSLKRNVNQRATSQYN